MSTIPDYPPPKRALDGTELAAAWQDGEQIALPVSSLVAAAVAESAYYALTSSTAAAVSSAARDVTLGFKNSAETANILVQIAALQVTADRSYVTTTATQVAADRAATAGYAAAAQAISFASVIDSKQNLVIGLGAAAPNDIAGNTDGNGVNLGTGAGAGQSQTYTRKPVSIGASTGINFRGYAACLVGAWTGARAVSDYSAFFGTHAGQDTNQTGRILPGFGTRALGNIAWLAPATVGATYTINGVVLTVAAVPASAYQFAPGATVAQSAANLLKALIGLSDAAILNGYYGVASAGATVLNVASASRGTYGNAFTLATNDASATVSGATLTAGTEYANSGNPNLSVGDAAVGFGALSATSRPNVRKATGSATFASNPTDGAFFRLGFNLTRTVTFKTVPVAALDVQIGATVLDTLVNLVAVLNASLDATIAAVTYWAREGMLIMEHDTAGTNSFETRSFTPALTFSSRALNGGFVAISAANVSLGHNSLTQSIVTASCAFGTGSGQQTTGANRFTVGPCGATSNGRDVVVIGENSASYMDGNDMIAIGRGQTSGMIQAYQAIVSISLAGVITFAAPHGWREGFIYAAAWRDRTAAGATIQRTTVGGSAWATIPSGLGGITLQAINAMQVQVVESLPSADTGGRTSDYRINGAPTNLDVARYTGNGERSITLGSDATIRPHTITLGHSSYRDGVRIDAIGLYLAAGDLRLPQVIPGTFANGNLRYPTALVDGETITLSDSTGSYTLTAKSTANMATMTTGMHLWFEIDASPLKTLRNFILALATNDDQSVARKIAGRVRFRTNVTAGLGAYLYWQLLDTGGSDFGISTSKGDAVATVSNAGTIGNLPTPTSLNPPSDTGVLMLTSSPANNGQPGPAQWNATRGWWACHRNAA